MVDIIVGIMAALFLTVYVGAIIASTLSYSDKFAGATIENNRYRGDLNDCLAILGDADGTIFIYDMNKSIVFKDSDTTRNPSNTKYEVDGLIYRVSNNPYKGLNQARKVVIKQQSKVYKKYLYTAGREDKINSIKRDYNN